MIRPLLFIQALALALAAPAQAQDPADEVASAPGALLRGLDKVSGELTDIEIAPGETKAFGRLAVTLSDCRYHVENPSADAFAQLAIIDTVAKAVVFDGWMIASSPALSALDHSRYDVWVIRCIIP